MTVTRRQFLGGALALTAGQLTTGCTFWQRPSLRVQVLDGTLPVQLLKLFRQQHRGQGKFKFVPVPSSVKGLRFCNIGARGETPTSVGRLSCPGAAVSSRWM
ncbi:MAG: twin-arginine translocation signal domain-containing protein [Synechococcales cyanobacterium RU_4_20]|nr:twin-arginine translocation signal domain-containing protein [Synechococcales cyanobacterium RU_4_20]NJR68715.1 twin-arginine translocation signal domain-containing protein [Synechococcales cyanobacterium CRU_2_2]